MRYLPHALRNFRETALANLLRAQWLIGRINQEIDPQFRMASTEGDWWIGIRLSDGQRARRCQSSVMPKSLWPSVSGSGCTLAPGDGGVLS